MPQNFPATGNAYLFNTPKSDRVGDLLLQQQRQRDFEAQRQNQLLDTQFSRNVSGMKDADIPELTQKWGDYKQAKLDLYKNGSKMNNNDRIQAELDAQRKLGAAYGVINSSKEDLATIKSHAVAVAKDTKGLYADDARDKLRQWTETPTSQRDKSKDGDIFYPYSIPNLDEELKTARGKQEDFTLNLGQSGTDPMKDDKEIYKVGNNARQFYDSFIGSMVSTNKGTNFTGLTNHIHSDSELEDLKNKYYAKVNDPKYILVHGQPQDFPESSNTNLGKAVKIKAMEEVVNSPFVPTRKVSETNLERYNALKNNQSKDAATLSYERALEKQKIGINAHKDNLDKMMGGSQSVDYPLNKIVNEYGVDHTIKSAEGDNMTTVKKVYEDGLPTGELNRYNKLNKDGKKEVEPYQEPSTVNNNGETVLGRKYYLATKNSDGNSELLGKKGKVGADESRVRKINSEVPSNKNKQGIYFNKKATSNPIGAAKIIWKK